MNHIVSSPALHTPTRRTFLGAGCAVFVTAVSYAAKPFVRTQGINIRYAIPSYSFRKSFRWFKGKPQAPQGKPLDTFGFLDLCRSLGVGAELTSYFFPPDADKAFFRKVKRYAHVTGVPIVGTAIGNNFSLPAGDQLDAQVADAIAWIDKAAILGAPHVRFFPGKQIDFSKGDDRVENAIKALQTCADHAAKHGIFIGVENHGQISPELLLRIIKGVESDWIGINLDTGNFVTETPYADLATCVDYAVNVQVKVMMKKADRSKYPADFGRIANMLHDANYQGAVVLEYEEEHPHEEIPKYLAKLKKAMAR